MVVLPSIVVLFETVGWWEVFLAVKLFSFVVVDGGDIIKANDSYCLLTMAAVEFLFLYPPGLLLDIGFLRWVGRCTFEFLDALLFLFWTAAAADWLSPRTMKPGGKLFNLGVFWWAAVVAESVIFCLLRYRSADFGVKPRVAAVWGLRVFNYLPPTAVSTD